MPATARCHPRSWPLPCHFAANSCEKASTARRAGARSSASRISASTPGRGEGRLGQGRCGRWRSCAARTVGPAVGEHLAQRAAEPDSPVPHGEHRSSHAPRLEVAPARRPRLGRSRRRGRDLSRTIGLEQAEPLGVAHDWLIVVEDDDHWFVASGVLGSACHGRG